MRPRTHASYADLVRLHISPELGRIPLTKLSPQDIQGFINRKLASGLSPATVKYLYAVLHRALGQAYKWSLIARNPATLVQPPRVPQAEVRPFSPDDARRFLEAVRGERLEALYSVALAVGLRQGEALGLRWHDVDLDAGTLTVRDQLQRLDGAWHFVEPKTARSRRTAHLPPPSSQPSVPIASANSKSASARAAGKIGDSSSVAKSAPRSTRRTSPTGCNGSSSATTCAMPAPRCSSRRVSTRAW